MDAGIQDADRNGDELHAEEWRMICNFAAFVVS